MQVTHSESKVIFEGKDITMLKTLFDSIQVTHNDNELVIDSDSWMATLQRQEYRAYIDRVKSTLNLHFG